jgi:hypothetical protein
VLSERDRKILAEIERELSVTDPGLVHRFRSVMVGGICSSRDATAGARSTDREDGSRKEPPSAWLYLLAVLGPMLLVIVSALWIAPVIVLCCLLLGGGLAIRARRRRKRGSG